MNAKKFLSPVALALMVGAAMPAQAHGHHNPWQPKPPVYCPPTPCPTPTPTPCPPPTGAVPEPGSIALVGVGALGLVPLVLRARKSSRNQS